MPRSFAVVAEAVGGRTDGERASGHRHARVIDRRGDGRLVATLGAVGAIGEHLEGLQNGLGVLGLVLGDHLERKPSSRQRRPVAIQIGPGEHVEGALTHGGQVGAAPLSVQERDLCAFGPRSLERIVGALKLGVLGWRAAEGACEPQLFVGGDVPQIPYRRTHDRVGCARQVALGERRIQLERSLANGGELLCQCCCLRVHLAEDRP